MARDAFIKFGERDELGPDKRPLPLIEGDSSDEEHYWWTELRSYDFSMRAGQRPREEGSSGSGGGSNSGSSDSQPAADRSRPELGDLTITKKVDWGSADLFRKCCEAAEATTKRSDEREGRGKIEKVVIEICRESGVADEGRIPFLTVTYHDVYVISYSVNISEPEPVETLTLKCEKAEFEYIQTDPYTGGRKQGGTKRTAAMVQQKQANIAMAAAISSGGGSGGSVANPAVTLPGATIAGGAAALTSTTSAAPAPGAGGTPAAAPVSTEAQISANFPGVLQGNGFGILPD
jgi:type VI protein secretion system component Hcp